MINGLYSMFTGLETERLKCSTSEVVSVWTYKWLDPPSNFKELQLKYCL